MSKHCPEQSTVLGFPKARNNDIIRECKRLIMTSLFRAQREKPVSDACERGGGRATDTRRQRPDGRDEGVGVGLSPLQ